MPDIEATVVVCLVGLFHLEFSQCVDTASGLSSDGICQSDWNLHTRPLAQPGDFAFLSVTDVNQTASDNVWAGPDMEIEFEEAYASDYFQRFRPQGGDLVTVHGRPIIDCGHCPYKSEIHPPDMMVAERDASVLAIDGVAIRQTDAYVWFNGFLPPNGPFPNSGEGPFVLPVTATAHAPPRTSATSHLVFTQNENGYVKLLTGDPTFSFVFGGMQLQLAALAAQFEVDNGQWLFPDSGAPGYVDHWSLHWEESN